LAPPNDGFGERAWLSPNTAADPAGDSAWLPARYVTAAMRPTRTPAVINDYDAKWPSSSFSR
jgi:hypothetical protein